MIHLFILRHGEASFDAPTDDERILTARGEADVERVCLKTKDQLSLVDDIFVSPLVRAQQTAQIACHSIGKTEHTKYTIDTWPLLKPESDVRALIDSLLKHVLDKNTADTDRTILLVAHQPLVSRLLESLCELDNTGRSSFSNFSSKYSMGTAHLAYVTLHVMAASCGTLEWIRHGGS